MRSPATGSSAAAFRHRTSRAGDPQLHTHVLVANLTLGADGRWSTLDARRIYAHAKTAGYLYEARLRRLTRELGSSGTPVRNGIAEIAGVAPPVLRAFSRRRADIEAELERRGASGAAAAQVATLATRRAKDYRVTPEQLVPEWRERAAASGSYAERCASSSGGRQRGALDGDWSTSVAAARWSGRADARVLDFTRRDLLQGLCKGCRPARTWRSRTWSGSPTVPPPRSAWWCSRSATDAAERAAAGRTNGADSCRRTRVLDAGVAGARRRSSNIRRVLDARARRARARAVERASRGDRPSRASRPRWCGA